MTADSLSEKRSAVPQPTGVTPGAFLREARERRGLSITRLAQEAGVSSGWLVHGENNRWPDAKINTIWKYARVYDIDPLELCEVWLYSPLLDATKR